MKESAARIATGNKEGSEGIEETRGVIVMLPRRNVPSLELFLHNLKLF